MIYLSEKARCRLKELDWGSLYVVTDFDNTITETSSYNSWAVLERNNFISEDYTRESLELYDHYFPREFDYTTDPEIRSELMHEWWNKVVALFVKYGLKEEMVNRATSNVEVMRFRDGGKEFLVKMHRGRVPVVILSAGIGNFIEQFLRHNDCLFDNIYIISNFIKFEGGVAVGVEDTIIHTYNKNVVAMSDNIVAEIGGRKDILLLGDNLGDTKMVPDERREDTVRVGFLDRDVDKNLERFRAEFDVVCTGNTSFGELGEVLGIK
jgi:5'-nucleotidase